MSNVAIDLTKTVKEIITTMKTAIDNLNTDVSSNKTAIDNLKGQILQAVYPVGSVYVSITDSRNPADILGFGTWEALPAGYGLVAQGTATAEDGSKLTFTAGQKSGEFKHQITVGESARHGHLVRTWNLVSNNDTPKLYKDGSWSDYTDSIFKPSGQWYVDGGRTNDTAQSGHGDPAGTTDGTGGNAYHNNMPPYIACYLWKRTA